MHIIFDARTSSPHFPGIGRYVRGLLTAMEPLLGDDRLTLLVSEGVEMPDLLIRSSAVSCFSVEGPFFSIRGLRRIPEIVRELSADIFHTPYLLAPVSPGVPFVVTLHDLIPLSYPWFSSWRARMVYRFRGVRVLRAADCVVAVSEYSAAEGVRLAGLDASRVIHVPHGIEALFKPAEALGEAIRLEPYLLYVGSDRPHKGLDILLDAYSDAEDLPLLKIVGMQSERLIRRKQAQRQGLEGRIEWVGAVDDALLPEFYRNAMGLVMPSRVEGFGFPVLEAMACGCPVVASDIPPLKELAGGAASFFDSGSAESLRDALRELCGNRELRKSMRNTGLTRAKTHSWPSVASEVLTVYRRIAGGCGR